MSAAADEVLHVVGQVAERMGLVTESEFVRAAEAGRERRRNIERNLATVADLEAKAERITTGPGGRCFVLPGEELYVIHNQQPPGSEMWHSQWVMPVTREDAEDFYGYVRPPTTGDPT